MQLARQRLKLIKRQRITGMTAAEQNLADDKRLLTRTLLATPRKKATWLMLPMRCEAICCSLLS